MIAFASDDFMMSMLEATKPNVAVLKKAVLSAGYKWKPKEK